MLTLYSKEICHDRGHGSWKSLSTIPTSGIPFHQGWWQPPHFIPVKVTPNPKTITWLLVILIQMTNYPQNIANHLEGKTDITEFIFFFSKSWIVISKIMLCCVGHGVSTNRPPMIIDEQSKTYEKLKEMNVYMAVTRSGCIPQRIFYTNWHINCNLTLKNDTCH